MNRRRDEFVAHDGDDGVLLLGFLAVQVSFHIHLHLKKVNEGQEERNVLNNRLGLRRRVTTVRVLGDSRHGGLVVVELLLDGAEETHID